jgi:hypothetical protein
MLGVVQQELEGNNGTDVQRVAVLGVISVQGIKEQKYSTIQVRPHFWLLWFIDKISVLM